jgi:hypothetical protein
MNNNTYKIGGEFEISSQLLKNSELYISNKEQTLFSSGRHALMAILEEISNDCNFLIYLPYYICSSVDIACNDAKYLVKFYEPDKNYLFPLEYLSKIEQNASILTVNYFGLVDDNSIINKLKANRPDITIISDHVQALWTCENSDADFSFTSLRKHIATPDGAIVFKKKNLFLFNRELKENSFYKRKLQGAFSKFNRESDNIYLKHFEEGEILLDNEKHITTASNIGKYIFENTIKEEIIEKRKQNYKIVYELGSKMSLEFIFPYNKNDIPMCVPIKIINRNKLRTKLIKNNIFLPIHWPISGFNKNSKIAQEMANYELSIVIDQRYSVEEMYCQINTLKKLL